MINPLKDVLKDSVDGAKQAGIWQMLTLKEKIETVRYLHHIIEQLR